MGENIVNSNILRDILKKEKYLLNFLCEDSPAGLDKSECGKGGLSLSEKANKLSEGLIVLENEIDDYVTENYNDIVQYGVRCIKRVQDFEDVSKYAQDLKQKVDILRNATIQPFDNFETNTKSLRHLHEVRKILRRCVTFLKYYLTKPPSQSLLEASSRILELEEQLAGCDISEISAIGLLWKNYQNDKNTIRKEAECDLIKSLERIDLDKASLSIQILTNLGAFENFCAELSDKYFNDLKNTTKRVFDFDCNMEGTLKSKGINMPGKITGATFPSGKVSENKSKLWSNWSELLEEVRRKCEKILILQTAVDICYRQSTNQKKMDSPARSIVTIFWENANDILSNTLMEGTSKSVLFVKQTLESEYPKLIRLNAEMSAALKQFRNQLSKTVKIECAFPFEFRSSIGHSLENAYLSLSIARLLDQVNGVFCGEGPPTNEQVDKLVRIIIGERTLSLTDANFAKIVARNISKSIDLFCMKCEQLCVTDGDANQIIGPATTSQRWNQDIANVAYYFKDKVERNVRSQCQQLENNCAGEEDIFNSLKKVDDLNLFVLSPLSNSIIDAVDAILLTMHQEDYKSQDKVTNSLYLKEMSNFIERAVQSYLKPYKNAQVIKKLYLDLATRCIELFLQQVSLVRPIGAGGRRKLLNDFKIMEDAMKPLCTQLTELGQIYKTFRGVRSLIACQSFSEMAENEEIGKSISYSQALMTMFVFAPDEMLSPHQSCEMSITRFSSWLDSHKSERDRLQLISGTLQRYQNLIRRKYEANFHPVYPVMMNLVERGLKTASS